MDNYPPGYWNGVVQTPLRKLWVQCQRVATSMSKGQDSSSAIRELLSPLVVTGRSALSPPTLRKTLCHLIGDSTFHGVDGSVAFATGCSGREASGHPWQGPGRTLAGTPKKGVRDPPKRGGAGILNNVNFGGFNRS